MLNLNNQLFSLSSPEIDNFLGFKINEIERELFLRAKALTPEGNVHSLGHVLHHGNQTWVGLDPQTLNTPYEELKKMCDHLDPKAGSHMVDLGAGYGRLGIVLSILHPDVRFTGYELVSERVEEGARVFQEIGYELGELKTADLTSDEFKLPEAEYYFIYDFGKVSHIREILKLLEKLALKKNFKIIARGKGVRSIIDHEHPWLNDVYPVIREENFSIYSMSGEDSL